MTNKGKDISRGRNLTPEEAAKYSKVRKQVMDEFPPATTNVVRETIAKLRQLREDQGLSLAEIEKQSGMTRANLCRLENEGRNVELRTLDRYAPCARVPHRSCLGARKSCRGRKSLNPSYRAVSSGC